MTIKIGYFSEVVGDFLDFTPNAQQIPAPEFGDLGFVVSAADEHPEQGGVEDVSARCALV